MAGLKKKKPSHVTWKTIKKNITLQSQNRRTRQKWIDIQPNTQIHDRSLYWIGTGTYRRGRVKKKYKYAMEYLFVTVITSLLYYNSIGYNDIDLKHKLLLASRNLPSSVL